MKRVIILNPQSRHGTGGRVFEEQRCRWEELLGGFNLIVTKRAGEASEKVASLLEMGEVDQILVAGGDGSINEALQGYWCGGKKVEIPLGVINLGTGGDFFRSLERMSEDYESALVENRWRWIDAAEVKEGGGDARFFVNISSLGMAGEMLRSLKASKFQSGAAAYFFHTIRTLSRYRSCPVKLELFRDGGDSEVHEMELLNLFVCNGCFSGGGMQWAPAARLDSGELWVTVIEGPRKWPLVVHSRKVYAGRIDEFPGARTFRARELRVSSASPLSLEADGEILATGGSGGGVFRYRVLPGAIPLVL